MSRLIHPAFALLAVWPLTAAGQSACTVREETHYRTLTGIFSAGSTTVTVTLPRSLWRGETATLYLEVSAADAVANPYEMSLEPGGQAVAVQDGAALHLAPAKGDRILFSLAAPDGRRLCTWQPPIRVWTHSPPQVEDGFRTVPFNRYPTVISGFRNAGDPILLQVGGPLAAGSGNFRIDEAPARILARTSWQVILRDPHPAAGLRTIASQGYAITLPFVFLELRPERRPHGRDTLEIRVSGLASVNLPPMPAAVLSLANYSRETMSVLCGKSYLSDDEEWVEARMIELRRDSHGEFTSSCKVKFRRPGPVSLDGMFTEHRRLVRPLNPLPVSPGKQ